jgi:hypothetical protein
VIDDDELLERREVAKILRISERGVDRIPEDQLEWVHIGRRKLARRGAVRDLIRRNARGGSQPIEA